MTLGEKIKKARISLSMTQSELVGDKITRNMLSAIESNKANPSMDTLSFLAERLDLPLSYLLTDDDDPDFHIKKELLPELKKAINDGKYNMCVSLASGISVIDDEVAYIYAKAYYELGKSAVKSGTLKTAKKYLSLSKEFCKKTFYDTTSIEISLPLYSAFAENIAAPLLEFDSNQFHNTVNESIDYELYKYMIGDLDFDYQNEQFKMHLQSKQLMRERKYKEAIRILTLIEELKSKYEYNSFLVFGIYIDLESCYKQVYDFENAYKYASKRMSLLEAFNI